MKQNKCVPRKQYLIRSGYQKPIDNGQNCKLFAYPTAGNVFFALIVSIF